MGLTGALFVLAFLVGAFYAFARHPIYGLMTYVAVYSLHPPARWWGQPIASYRWSLLAAGITLIAVFASRKRRVKPGVPVLRHKVMVGLTLFFVYLVIQNAWAMDPKMHQDMTTLFAKYVLLVGLIYVCVDSEKHLKLFLWTHVLGCVYLGWIAYTTYDGGRFEGFGGPDINEANAGALQIVTGIFCASVLILSGTIKQRVAIFSGLPLIVNALVATVSRSGFLELACGGLMFNIFTPPRFKKIVKILSIVAVVGFLLITNPLYWMRMSSMKYAGEEVQGVDTGGGRLVLIAAQWQMFQQHPLGCGHRCTAVLSPKFLDDSRLTGEGAQRARSSHNSVMTMLVEHGVLGGVAYFALLIWILRTLRELARKLKGREGFLPVFLPAIASILIAIAIGDCFVDYVLQEVRIWFVGILMAMVALANALPPAPQTPVPVGRGQRAANRPPQRAKAAPATVERRRA